MESEDHRRLFEYFIVAGLDEKKELIEFPTQNSEGKSVAGEQKPPITDICVVFSSAGETTPHGYERIETTSSGYPANLNHGSLRSAACFLCIKRGYHKPPLIDLGILDDSRGEKAMRDAVVIDKTPYGLSANVSNSNSQKLYFTIRRAQTDIPPHQLVITDICVILENKGELPPHTYYKVPKNLNRSMLGSEVYICYKKSQLVCKRIAYKPSVLDCFPRVRSDEDSILVQNVPKFFLPMGSTIEAWPERCRGTERSSGARTFSTCVFTDEAYTKYYGTSITFYEPYTEPLSEQQREKLDLGQNDTSASILASDESEENGKVQAKPAEEAFYYCNKAICIVSRYPFFEPFRRFLFFLLNMVTLGESRIPIERYISHLMYEVPFPSPARPRILMELGSDMIAFENSDDSQIPLTGANFVDTLKCLGTENLLYAMLLTLLEQKILVHSLRPWLLASVTETFCALVFPFSWQLPYIPQCPLEVADIFHAPLSFMAGVDSRYFDLKDDPPSDVTCFDLDTSTVSNSTIRKFYRLDMLPKKPLKKLRAALDAIVMKSATEKIAKNSKDSEQAHLRRMQSEFAIREAFLKFICALMDDYSGYLRPLMCCPKEEGATDVQHLFDWDHFLQSRDKNAIDFYQKFRETTSCIRFIEERSGALIERSGAVDRSIYYVFFDDCIARLRAEAQNIENSKDKSAAKEGYNNLRLLDCDSMRANRTIVVQSPQLLNPKFKDHNFHYSSFPQQFDDSLFEKQFIAQAAADRPPQHTQNPHEQRRRNFFMLRTQQEIRKSTIDMLALVQQNGLYWPRSVLFYAYSIWFMQLPSLMAISRNKRKMLLLGLRVLSRMEQLMLPFHDQVCYRLLMQLCGEYGRPEMCIRILHKMLSLGIDPNAITYKVYHQALMQSEWPSDARLSAIDAWRRIRVRLEITVRFRALLPQHFETAVENDPSGLLEVENQENLAMSGNSSIIQEIGAIDLKEETVPVINEHPKNELSTNNEPVFKNNNTDAISLDPLGAELNNSTTNTTNSKPMLPPQRPPSPRKMQQPTKEGAHPLEKPILATANSASAGHIQQPLNPYLSPSRAKFIREHSASPFAGEEKSVVDDESSLNSEKRRKKSLKTGGSWLKAIAANSPILNTLMPRSQTTENLDKVSRDGSVHSDAPSASTSTTSASPNLFTLANKMRKKAMRTYNDMVGPATELLERSGLNPSKMLNDAKLNLSKSYRSADRSELSTVSSNEHLVETNSDFFFLCTKRAKDLLSINYWMQDILPEENSELHEVWLRKDNNDESFSQEEFLDVMICSSSLCSFCEHVVYDDELTMGWAVDDANLNSVCPHCQHSFAPLLKICIRIRPDQQSLDITNTSTLSTTSSKGKIVQTFTVPYVSPLVLRRELEGLLASEGPLGLSRPSMRVSHPIIFWNMFYICRRLELPTHLLTWVSPAVVIHCVQSMFKLPTAADEHEQQQQESE